MSAPVFDLLSWPRSRTLPLEETPESVRQLAMYLAYLNGESWTTWTDARRRQIETIAIAAVAAVKETHRAD